MSSGTRRFNYTRRRRISRQHISIAVHDLGNSAPPHFEAVLQLGTYDLPSDAMVFLEAYRQAAYQRFDFGSVGLLTPPPDRLLTEFGGAEGVQFRLKVVERSDSVAGHAARDRPARIIAQADRIRPTQAGSRRSLLPVDPWDVRDQVWQLEIDEETGPLLKISRHLAPDRHALVRSPPFETLVLPEVLKTILSRALTDGVPDADESADTWQWKWVHLACDLMGVMEPPLEVEDSPDAAERWVSEVVARFCRQHRISTTFLNWWKERS